MNIELEDFDTYLIERMKDRERAEMYLKVSFQARWRERDPEGFLIALDTVVPAQGGVEKLAQKMGMSPEALSKILSGEQKPSWDANIAIVKALGFEAALDIKGAMEATCTCKA